VALLTSQGAHPEAIKRYMGHSSVAGTMDIYGHLFPSVAEDLADKLDEPLPPIPDGQETDKMATRSHIRWRPG